MLNMHDYSLHKHKNAIYFRLYKGTLSYFNLGILVYLSIYSNIFVYTSFFPVYLSIDLSISLSYKILSSSIFSVIYLLIYAFSLCIY